MIIRFLKVFLKREKPPHNLVVVKLDNKTIKINFSYMYVAVN